MYSCKGGESGSRRSEFGRNDNDDGQTEHLPSLHFQTRQFNREYSLGRSHFLRSTPNRHSRSSVHDSIHSHCQHITSSTMEQTRAINALAPFLALSKSATSARAAADLVTQATSAAHAYVFGELLQTPNMQNLRNDAQYRNYYTLLELFAWGTWAEYQGTTTPLSLPLHAKN